MGFNNLYEQQSQLPNSETRQDIFLTTLLPRTKYRNNFKNMLIPRRIYCTYYITSLIQFRWVRFLTASFQTSLRHHRTDSNLPNPLLLVQFENRNCKTVFSLVGAPALSQCAKQIILAVWLLPRNIFSIKYRLHYAPYPVNHFINLDGKISDSLF